MNTDPPRAMSVLAAALAAFLVEHRQDLLDLIGSGSPLDRFQVEIHTLAGIAWLFPDHAKLVRVSVSPRAQSGGSHVSSSVLSVDGQWFEFDGPVQEEAVFLSMEQTAARDARKVAGFEREKEEFSTRAPHPVIMPYLQRHFLPLLAQKQAKVLSEGATQASAIARPVRL